jgi:hypothetical protein
VLGGNTVCESGLLALGRRFAELKRELEATQRAGRLGASDIVLNHGDAVDTIHAQLFSVACAATHAQAVSLDELKVQARLLLEYADRDTSDIVGGLIKRLCEGVLALAGPTADRAP